jgi:hypothetical protein
MTHPELKARIASAYNAALDRRGQSAVSHRDHFGQRVVELADLRVQFRHAGVANVLPVTDPFAEWAWLAKPDGEYAVPGALLCISAQPGSTRSLPYVSNSSTLQALLERDHPSDPCQEHRDAGA